MNNILSDKKECKTLIKVFYLCMIMLFIFAARTDDGFAQTWQSLGPEGGPLTSIIQHPTDSNILYVSPDGYPGAIYKSTDKGETWQFLAELDSRVLGLAIDPKDPLKLYAVDSYDFHKSNDGGVTWDRTYLKGYIFADIFVDLHNSEILHAHGRYYDGTSTQIAYFKSTDRGDSWLIKHPVISTANPIQYDLAVDPNNSDIIYTTFFHNPDNQYMRPVYKSTDGGDTWFDVTPETNLALWGIAIAPAPQNTIFIVSNGRVYRSYDGGNNWLESDGWVWGTEIFIDPTDPNILYTSESGISYQSTDGGNNWTEISTGLYGGFCHGLLVDWGNPNNIYHINNFGFFKTANSGGQWTLSNSGLIISRITQLNHLANAPHVLYAGTEEGLYKTTNALSKALTPSLVNWEQVDDISAYSINVISPAPQNPDILYITHQYG